MEVNGQLNTSIDLPSGKNRGTRWVRDWLGPRSSLDVFQNRWKSFPCSDSNLGSFTSSPSLIADYAVPAPGDFSSLAPVLSSIFFHISSSWCSRVTVMCSVLDGKNCLQWYPCSKPCHKFVNCFPICKRRIAELRIHDITSYKNRILWRNCINA